MSSRWGESAYYERDASVYSPSRASRRRDYDDVDLESVRSARPARSVPDFLRDDYGRSNAGPLVRVPDNDDYDRPRIRPQRGEVIEKEEIIFREEKRAPSSRPRTVVDDDTRSVRSSRTTRTERTERTERPRPRPRSEERSKEEIDIRIRRDRDEPKDRARVRNQDREVEREEVVVRRTEAERPKSVVDREEITFRRGEVERSRPKEKEKEEIIIRRGRQSSSSSRSPSPPRRKHRDSSVASERIIFRPRERSLPPSRDHLVAREREEFIVRRRKPSPPSRSPSPSPPPPAREGRQEEIIIRRTERSPTPPPPPAPEPEPEIYEPPVVRRPIIREEIHREVITHHRHFDHGIELVPRHEPSPPPPPPEPEKKETLEVAIRRRDGNGSDEEIIFEHDESRRRHGHGKHDKHDGKHDKHEGKHEGKHKHRGKSRAGSVRGEEIEETQIEITRGKRGRSRAASTRGEVEETQIEIRHRSSSPSTRSSRTALAPPADDYDLAGEAEYYNRRALDRARPGEAYNGATRDWGVVDVPPGTSRVRMDGIGGGAQELTWQRYNGARRSRFIADGQDYVAYPDFDERQHRRSLPDPEPEREPTPPPPPKEEKTTSLEISIRERDRGASSTEIVKREKKPPKEMWTEITKDLVIKEAIEEMGYGYEETELFFYVMDYLRYEDVLRLVEKSDHIRRERKRRVKEIEYEREVIETIPRPPNDRVYERDVIYERRRR